MHHSDFLISFFISVPEDFIKKKFQENISESVMIVCIRNREVSLGFGVKMYLAIAHLITVTTLLLARGILSDFDKSIKFTYQRILSYLRFNFLRLKITTLLATRRVANKFVVMVVHFLSFQMCYSNFIQPLIKLKSTFLKLSIHFQQPNM